MSADIVVIGGGVIGASVAYHLTAKGAKGVVVIEQPLQCRDESSLVQACWYLEQNSLMESCPRPGLCQQTTNDRRRGKRPIRGSLFDGGVGFVLDDLCEFAQRGMEKDILWCESQPTIACQAHQPDRADAVASQMEEVVPEPHALHVQQLGDEIAKERLRR